MNKFYKPAKTALKTFAFWYVGYSVLYSSILFGINHFDKPDDLEKYKVADSLTQYFSYLAQSPVKSGSPAEDVIPAQKLLLAAGEDLGVCGADGLYGPDTRKAVKSYQSKHQLPQTGGHIDAKTYDHLINTVLQDKNAYSKIKAELLSPYQEERKRKLVGELPTMFSEIDAKIFLRPDAVIKSAYEMVANDIRDEAASMAFPGCANNHLRDAFRHSDSIFRIADISGTDIAVAIGDAREKGSYNSQELFLMDVYNHRAAADLVEHYEANDKDMSDVQQIFLQGIKDGDLAIYPYPLVPKDQKDNYAYLRPIPNS